MANRVDVGRMLSDMTAKSFLGWEAYASLEPFGELRADYRAASIAQVIANTMGRGKDQKPFTLKDMLLKWEEEPQKKQQTWQEQRQILTLLAFAHATPMNES